MVDGLLHVVGSDQNAVEQAMRDAAKRLALNIARAINMQGDGDTLVINVGAAPEASYTREATIWLAITKEQGTVWITRGGSCRPTLCYRIPCAVVSGRHVEGEALRCVCR